MPSPFTTYNDAPPPAYSPHNDGGAPNQDALARLDSLVERFRSLHHPPTVPQNSRLYVTRQPKPIKPITTETITSVPLYEESTREHRKWSHGLFNFWGDIRTCVSACFCPCITLGRNIDRYDHLQTTGYPHPDPFGRSCSAPCCAHAACIPCCGVACAFQAVYRGEIRERYGIDGSVIEDCFASTCCYPCQLTQESRQISLEERQWTEMFHV
ncbi:PLAC8-domain-containing protein [Guyanagaster necrorhizus]|uniref:PLAC8-domain-containing protein n=1 Tax=Guyanagaster necrorhizus TaxID=856835 RepID=A0A9P7VIH4_9AGAR|nr:PLAC8-domain-containing protein [Guyanagaster necrorhizus MCA 3950]KAG7440564.1 PLAC8-domain-containing protein [Guyanagaster necrorhizus MCA 3950]